MGMINLIINCQYYENYNVGPNGFGEVPYWKPKGGFQFKMPVDSDTVCYADNDVIVQAIKNLVEKQNTIAELFEYDSYEVEWDSPFVIEGLEDEVCKIYESAEQVI